jgi:HEAT repeat protein
VTEVAEQLVRFMEEVQGITHPEIEARWAALWSFCQVAEDGERKVEIVMPLLSDVESDLRFLAAECLGNSPAFAKPALAHLWQATHDMHVTVRNRALWALSKIYQQFDRER